MRRNFFYVDGAEIKIVGRVEGSRIMEVEVGAYPKFAAIGRSQPLERVIVWRGVSNVGVAVPRVEVKSMSGEIIIGGVYSKLPKDFRLRVFAEFDCRVIVRRKNITENKFYDAKEFFDIPDIKFGTAIKIFQGLDCVWSAAYVREVKGISAADEELFLKLERGRGKKIPIPHTWGSFADKLKAYPKVQRWLYKALRAGSTPEDSFLLFRRFILEAL